MWKERESCALLISFQQSMIFASQFRLQGNLDLLLLPNKQAEDTHVPSNHLLLWCPICMFSVDSSLSVFSTWWILVDMLIGWCYFLLTTFCVEAKIFVNETIIWWNNFYFLKSILLVISTKERNSYPLISWYCFYVMFNYFSSPSMLKLFYHWRIW